MWNASYIMVCDKDRAFTSLNRFDRRLDAFEGEYSLIHNTHSRDDHFLTRFLLSHIGHSLRVLSSEDDRCREVLQDYERFQEDDIPKYIEEKVLQQFDSERELEAKQSVGQIQLLIARQLIRKEWEMVQKRPAASDRDTYVLLGQEWAFRWSVHTIDDLVEQA